MTTSIISLGLFLLAVALVAGVLLAPIAVVAGNVFHAWGTCSALEWLEEALRRVFAGSLRRRLMCKVNRQSLIGVDKSRRTWPYLAVWVAPGDVTTLAGPGGALSSVAADAARGYLRHTKAQSLAYDAVPRVAIVPEESLRRGSVRVRQVGGQEFTELWHEMVAWDQLADSDHAVHHPELASALAPTPASPTPVPRGNELIATKRLSHGDVTTAAEFDPAHAVTAALDPEHAVTTPPVSPRIVLADARGTQHPISSTSVLIGRGRECGVRLDGADVSREHVNIYCQEGTWWLRDRGSRNGTTVDGREVRGAGPVRLTSRSRIVLGGEKAGEELSIVSLMEV